MESIAYFVLSILCRVAIQLMKFIIKVSIKTGLWIFLLTFIVMYDLVEIRNITIPDYLGISILLISLLPVPFIIINKLFSKK